MPHPMDGKMWCLCLEHLCHCSRHGWENVAIFRAEAFTLREARHDIARKRITCSQASWQWSLGQHRRGLA
ncbi:MAG: hypothetical protein ACI8SJ_000723 [Shewanella sp.]|jgi:hypothetical protein